MALNNTTADAAAASIVAALPGLTADQRSQATSYWQAFLRSLYASLKTDITITILSGAITTNGNASSQTGPPAPLPINPD